VASTLESLPGDIRRYIPQLVPSVAPKLQQLSRTLNAASRAAYRTLCELPIGTREVEALLDRRWRYLQLHPEIPQVGIWAGVYPPLAVMLTLSQTRWRLVIHVEIGRVGVTIVCAIAGGQREKVSVLNEAFRLLGWESARRLVLAAYACYITQPRVEWPDVRPSDYVVVLDRLSAYDILHRRVQCLAANPSYADDASEELIMEAWRRTVAVYSVEGVPEGSREHAAYHAVHNFVNGVDADLHDTLDEAQVRTLIREDVLPAALQDETLSIPFPLRRCEEGITRPVLLAYLIFLLGQRAGTRVAWVYLSGSGLWEGMSFYTVETSLGISYFRGFRRTTATRNSRHLGGDVVVDTNVNGHVVAAAGMGGTNKVNFTAAELADLYLSTSVSALDAKNLRRLSLTQEGCVQRDRTFPDRRTRKDITATFNRALEPYNVTLDVLVGTDYLPRHAKRPLVTRDVYSTVSILTFLIRHLLESGDAAMMEDRQLVLHAPYASLLRVVGWVMAQLTAFYAAK
jgi:hypothetical protein